MAKRVEMGDDDIGTSPPNPATIAIGKETNDCLQPASIPSTYRYTLNSVESQHQLVYKALLSLTGHPLLLSTRSPS